MEREPERKKGPWVAALVLVAAALCCLLTLSADWRRPEAMTASALAELPAAAQPGEAARTVIPRGSLPRPGLRAESRGCHHPYQWR